MADSIEEFDKVQLNLNPGEEVYNGDMRQRSVSGEPIGGMRELYEIASMAKPVFDAAISSIVSGLGMDLEESLLTTGLKDEKRATEKAKNDYSKRQPGPPLSWLFDIVRASVVCQDEVEMAAVVQELRAHPDIEVIRVKNRFRHPTAAGFRDLNISLRVRVQTSLTREVLHACEIQAIP